MGAILLLLGVTRVPRHRVHWCRDRCVCAVEKEAARKMLEARGFPKQAYAHSESFSLGGGTAEELLAKRCAAPLHTTRQAHHDTASRPAWVPHPTIPMCLHLGALAPSTLFQRVAGFFTHACGLFMRYYGCRPMCRTVGEGHVCRLHLAVGSSTSGSSSMRHPGRHRLVPVPLRSGG